MIETTKGVNNNQFFNFEEAKVQALTLEQLERTHRENDVYEKPLRGIYHFALIHQLIDMCNEIGYNVELYDLFAANNKDRTQPGVVRLRRLSRLRASVPLKRISCVECSPTCALRTSTIRKQRQTLLLPTIRKAYRLASALT